MSGETEHDVDHRVLITMTAEIAAAYVGCNKISTPDVSGVISSIFNALKVLAAGGSATAEEKPTPAVPIKGSVRKDYIVCLEDGRQLKMLKRHLRTDHNMTPEDYRAKWGLGSDYPMVAPNYAALRSKLAVSIGLGRGATSRRAKRKK